jgi:hypothetical protein
LCGMWQLDVFAGGGTVDVDGGGTVDGCGQG